MLSSRLGHEADRTMERIDHDIKCGDVPNKFSDCLVSIPRPN